MISIMKRVQYGLSAFVLVAATFVGNIAFSSQTSALAGSGTSGNPWLITSCADLQDMNTNSAYSDDYFLVTQNIDCSGVNFTRIMFDDNLAFAGTFNGAGYTIRNVAVNNSVTMANGFFGQINEGTVENLTLENITVSGEEAVGALAGFVDRATIENVRITSGTVTGTGDMESEFGGLAAYVYETELFDVIVNVDVVAPGAETVGGLVGAAYGGSILGQVAALGDVEGNENVGGLVGYSSEESSFDKAFATGNVVAHAGPGGGFVGSAEDSEFIGTYARGNVTGSGYLGGHTGIAGANTVIGWAYATGAVTPQGESIGGGLVGTSDDSATIQEDSFWDIETTGVETSGGNGEVGKTTAEMKDVNTYAPFAWNFEDYWFQDESVNDGYLCQIWYQSCYDAFVGNGGGSSDLPNNGDGNNDGTIDEDQDNVVTLLSPVSNKYVTVAADDSCVLSDVSIANASSHQSQDTGYDYKSGFVNFTATGCEEDVANVKLYYHGVTPEGVTVRKYNPITNTYFTITSASIVAAAAPLSGTVVSYTIVDNGELDIDDTDGVIVDPVGLAGVPGVPNTGVQQAGSLVQYVVVAALGFVGVMAGAIALVVRSKYSA